MKIDPPRIAVLALLTAPLGISVATAAPLPPDPVAVWTLQDENAAISTAKVTDRYYTNGLRLSYASGADAMPAPLNELATKLWGDGQRRFTIDVTQQIYTPFDTASKVPAKGDRPYAGLLMGTFGVMSDTEGHRSFFTAGFGVLGPAALGEGMQNGFHDLIGQRGNNGWATQLRNEAVAQITSSRVYRVRLGKIGNLETDMLPELTAGLGTVRTYVETGVSFRLGQGLEADYGVARVRPGPSGGDVFRRIGDFGWYVFAGIDGQAVARDITLDGNMFSRSNHVKRTPFIGEAQGGLALLFYGARLTYTHVVQSEQFRGQKGGLHQFGSLALSMRF